MSRDAHSTSASPSNLARPPRIYNHRCRVGGCAASSCPATMISSKRAHRLFHCSMCPSYMRSTFASRSRSAVHSSGECTISLRPSERTGRTVKTTIGAKRFTLFLSLPAELRNAIYIQYMEGQNRGFWWNRNKSYIPIPALLLTNQQVRREAAGYYWADGPFDFVISHK